MKKPEAKASGYFGGDEGDRTPYLLHAMQALSQVSYTPKFSPPFLTTIRVYHPKKNLSTIFSKNSKK